MDDGSRHGWTVELGDVTSLWFGPQDPVRAASAVARLGDGWLIAQDDAVHGAWWQGPGEQVARIRLLASRRQLDVFSEDAGTKHLKPDLEAACSVTIDGRAAVLLLGSGSLPNRTAGVLVELVDGEVRVRSRDLTVLYRRVAAALEVAPDQLNLEGACVRGDQLRWFQRGHGRSGVPSASVDLDLVAVLHCVEGRLAGEAVDVGHVRRYDLGVLDGLPLAVTDAVTLPDGRVCVSATAEDLPDAVADGPIAGSVLAVLDERDRARVLPLPPGAAGLKVEGLAVAHVGPEVVELLAVVDQDDPGRASTALRLRLRESTPG